MGRNAQKRRGDDMDWKNALGSFLDAQDHAIEQLAEASTEQDKYYWQGVKDGLRKCYAIFTNDPSWDAMGGGSPQQRPDNWR